MQLPMLQGSNKQQMLLAILRDVSIIVFFLNIFWVDNIMTPVYEKLEKKDSDVMWYQEIYIYIYIDDVY